MKVKPKELVVTFAPGRHKRVEKVLNNKNEHLFLASFLQKAGLKLGLNEIVTARVRITLIGRPKKEAMPVGS